MGGGLLQLVAYGAQDVYLTGNPQITFFKAVYRRHTNFAIEAIQQTFNGTPGYGQRVTCTIARNGDLIHRVYLALDLSASGSASENLCKFYGLRLVNYVEVEIGGQKIDKHYSHWMYIWNELSLPKAKKSGYYDMVGAVGGVAGTSTGLQKNLYVPLEFWFCRNVGLALPLISLQYHEVKINLAFETADRCKGTTSALTAGFGASLWCDYIFLDTDERRRFAQLSHEYLIEQLQFTGQEAVQSKDNIKPKLNFNHPCKELVWFVTSSYTDQNDNNNNWMNYTCPLTLSGTDNKIVSSDNSEKLITAKLAPTAKTASRNHVANAKLVLNGNDRFAQRNGSYFNLVQPFQHHENVPSNAGINVYSFSLKPEDHQPSGSLNMSRIDTAVLNLSMNTNGGYSSSSGHNLSVYAVNYNVLRIMSGMGGIAYSN
jgi:hypothetical protein